MKYNKNAYVEAFNKSMDELDEEIKQLKKHIENLEAIFAMRKKGGEKTTKQMRDSQRKAAKKNQESVVSSSPSTPPSPNPYQTQK